MLSSSFIVLPRHWLDPPEVHHPTRHVRASAPLGGRWAHRAASVRLWGHRHTPVARSKISLPVLGKVGSARRSLSGRRSLEEDLGRTFLNGRRWSTNREVVLPQVFFLSLVKLGSEGQRIALMGVTGARQGGKVVLLVYACHLASIAVVEVTSLDLVLEVLVHHVLGSSLQHRVGSHARSHISITVGFAKQDGSLLGWDVVQGSF